MSDSIDTNNKFLNEAYTLVRAPLDPATGQPLEKCGYALFPGMALAQSEPQLIVLLYDALLHQHPDTAMLLYKGRDGADPLLNRKWSERLLTRWRNLGKPTVIIATPEDMKFFRGILTEIPTVSLYDLLLSRKISGGCHHELYRLSEPAPYGFPEAVKELAEMMGVEIYEPGAASAADGVSCTAVPQIDPADVAKIPFLTSSIDVRNAMKKQGFDAVHILELIFGMGASNQHLAHVHGEHQHGHGEHSHGGSGHDHTDHEHGHSEPSHGEHEHGHGDHGHGTVPQIRETVMSDEEKSALADLFSPEAQKRNLQQLHDMLLSLFWGE